MRKKNQVYLEELHQTIGDLFHRVGAYSSGVNKQELAQLQSEYSKLSYKQEKNHSNFVLPEESIRSLEKMGLVLLTMLENVLFTI